MLIRISLQLYVHWWDYNTSIPELMQSLNHLVASGKVLYLGISDSPAWVVRYASPLSLDIPGVTHLTIS